ncbi:MAG: hypothetical protein PHU74_01940 [Candidatus Pacebacteria bacterium]|nr:hypothetical protein [Candidatus Paceibacterota bacterium]
MFKNKKVQNIISLEIIFNESKIIEWIQNDFKGDLLLGEEKDEDIKVSRLVDILPHPNGTDSIFFHRKTNRFSNFLDAYEFGVFENSDKILGVEWKLVENYLVLYVLVPSNKEQEDSKPILIVPTFKISQMQIKRFVEDDEIKRIQDKYNPKILNLNDKEFSAQYLNRVSEQYLRGGSGDNLIYKNDLSCVAIYSSPSLMNYNFN